MLHLRARRLLVHMLDQELPEETRLKLDVHVASCARCRRLRREHRFAQGLLEAMPAVFAPLEHDPRSYSRLVSLTRWSQAPAPTRRNRYVPPFLALASAAVILMLAASLSHWPPIVQPYGAPVSLVGAHSGTPYLASTGSSGRF